MSDAHSTTDHDAPHEGPIKTPKQLILAVFFSFVIPIAAIVLLVIYVTSSFRPAAGTQSLEAEAVARRIQPVGRVEIKDATDVASLKTGEQVYQAQCTACHAAGVAGAPKSGDADAWAPRIKTGYEALLASALKGKGAMGAQGGGDFSEFEIGRAVVYLANRAGAKFAEPVAPGGAASAPEGAAGASAPQAAAGASAPQAMAAAEPADAASVKVEGGVVTFYFASGKAELAAGAAPALAEVNKGVAGGKKVVVSGYHDATGNPAKNAELAKQRAFAARDALKAAGVAEDKIELKKPEQINAGTAADARRVEVKLE
jgi:cytochrome c5